MRGLPTDNSLLGNTAISPFQGYLIHILCRLPKICFGDSRPSTASQVESQLFFSLISSKRLRFVIFATRVKETKMDNDMKVIGLDFFTIFKFHSMSQPVQR